MNLKKHIPNILSSSRLLSPLVLIPLILNNSLVLAVIALSAFFLTDALDGHLARKWNVQSELGAKIDAVADKTILASLIIPLVISNPLLILTLGLEGVISVINVIRKVNGGVPKTVQLGRIKMVIISLFIVILYLTKVVMLPNFIISSLYALTSLFQIGTIIKYIEEGIKEQKTLNKKKKVCNKNKNIENAINEEKKLEKQDKLIFSKVESLIKEKDELLKLKEELLDLYNFNELEVNLDKPKKMLKR